MGVVVVRGPSTKLNIKKHNKANQDQNQKNHNKANQDQDQDHDQDQDQVQDKGPNKQGPG